MANFVRNITKQTKTFEELPEFIRNLANLVFMMNDSKGNRLNFMILNNNCIDWLADGKWDMEEYRNGSVAWCPGVTDVSVVDAAFESLLTVSISVTRWDE